MQLAAIQSRVAARLLTLREQEAASPPEGAVLTAEQIAQRLQVTVAWVYRHRKQLGGWKADGHVRPPKVD